MPFLAILALSVGLAMDATAVAAARGLAATRLRPRHALEVGLCFGGFQAVMPLIGYAVGARFGRYVAAWDHFIAFGLLCALGLKMLNDARSAGEETLTHDDGALFSLRTLLLLGVATSIDALAVGVTLPMLNAPLALTIVTIFVTTAALSALGLYLGRHFGAMLGKRLDVFGGLVLIGLGTKILFEHLRDG